MPASTESLRNALLAADWAQAAARLPELLPADCATQAYLLRAQDREAEAETALLHCLGDCGRESRAAGLLREWLLTDQRWPDLDRWLPEARPGQHAIEDRVLAAARAHRAGNFSVAAALCEDVLKSRPDHASAQAHKARAEHNQGLHARALAGLESAVACDPLYAEGWHSLGIATRAAGDFDSAIQAFQRALVLRPGYRRAAIDLAKSWLAQGRFAPAAELLSCWRQRLGNDASIATDLGLALHQLGRLDEADALLRAAVAIDPDRADTWLQLGALRSHRGDSAGANDALQCAIRLDPRDADAWSELAALHEQHNRLPEMRQALERGLAIAPRHPVLLLESARHERRSGHAEAGVATLSRIEQLQLPPWRHKDYWFELGRSLDLLQRTDQAWHAFVQGNRLAAAQFGDDLQFLPRLLEQLQLELGRSNRSSMGSDPGQSSSPTFLLGFPRSGLTLLNTMLGGHSRIVALEEKPTLEACVERVAAMPGGYPVALAQLNAGQLEALRAEYWQRVAEYAPGFDSDARLVDTFPIRTLHVALIARLFPGARIVFMARHPADVVLSNFMQDYAANPANAQFTDLQRCAATYAATLQLWRTARERLPLRMHTLRYEELVQSSESVLRPLLDFLDVDWQPTVLDDYLARAGKQRIATSSYHQVAEPLNTRGIGRWQRYRMQLAPVLPLLATAADDLGYRFE